VGQVYFHRHVVVSDVSVSEEHTTSIFRAFNYNYTRRHNLEDQQRSLNLRENLKSRFLLPLAPAEVKVDCYVTSFVFETGLPQHDSWTEWGPGEARLLAINGVMVAGIHSSCVICTECIHESTECPTNVYTHWITLI
jgi:hypothetical protein